METPIQAIVWKSVLIACYCIFIYINKKMSAKRQLFMYHGLIDVNAAALVYYVPGIIHIYTAAAVV